MTCYLDYNATSIARPEAIEAAAKWLGGGYNSSSAHSNGRKAKAALEDARTVVAAELGVVPSLVTFTSSGTEANNQILRCAGADAVFVSAIEHASVIKTAQKLYPDASYIIPVDANGEVIIAELVALLGRAKASRPLVSVMLANNETGVIQPIAAIAEAARKFGAIVHSDAVQAFGKIPFTLSELGVDAVSLSTHKCGAPIGAGVLATNGCMPIEPLLIGGGHESNLRAGTVNISAIAAFAEAIKKFSDNYNHMKQLEIWRDAVEQKIIQQFPQAKIAGAAAPRLPNTSCIMLPGVENSVQLMSLDMAGILISSGSACSSGKVAKSHVLEAMGVLPEFIGGAIRVSSGWSTTQADYDRFYAVWSELVERILTKEAA